MTPLMNRPAWAALQAHHAEVAGTHLRELFATDPERGERLTAEACGIYLDYSKNRVTDETLRLLLQLAEESGLRGRIDAMFAGEKINVTEDRAVLHVALRAPGERDASRSTASTSCPAVHEVLDRMAEFADTVRAGAVARPHRQADPQHRQHRHRRLRPRPGDGVRGAAALQRSAT